MRIDCAVPCMEWYWIHAWLRMYHRETPEYSLQLLVLHGVTS